METYYGPEYMVHDDDGSPHLYPVVVHIAECGPRCGHGLQAPEGRVGLKAVGRVSL